MKRSAGILSAQAMTIIGLLSLWQWLSVYQPFISNPVAIAVQLTQWSAEVDKWQDVLVTLEEATLGFLLGVALALTLGITVGSSGALARFLDPFIVAGNVLPKLALAPLFIVLFGIGLPSKIYFVATSIFFIPFFSTVTAMRALDGVVLQNARILGAGRGWIMRDIYAPALLGVTIRSLRLTVAWAILAAVIAESIVANSGIGMLINKGQFALRNDIVLGGVALVSIVVFILDRLLLLLQVRFSTWRLA